MTNKERDETISRILVAIEGDDSMGIRGIRQQIIEIRDTFRDNSDELENIRKEINQFKSSTKAIWWLIRLISAVAAFFAINWKNWKN